MYRVIVSMWDQVKRPILGEDSNRYLVEGRSGEPEWVCKVFCIKVR